MRTLPTTMLHLLNPFVPLFSRRLWPHVQVLLAGAILAPGKRTVSAALRVMGLGQTEHFQRYHRVLSRAVWSGREASGVLLGLLVKTFVADGPLVIGVDETLERRWGKKIAAKGVYRDPVRSTHERFVKSERPEVGMPDALGARALGATRLGVAVLERACSVGALLRPAGQTAQEDNRLGTADAPPSQALVARTGDRGRGRFRIC